MPDLMNQLLQTVEVLGVSKTLEVLQKAEYGGVPFSNKNVEFVVTTVGAEMRIPNHEIIFGVGRKNDRKIAIGFCAVYLDDIYKYSREEIAEFLNKDVNTCHRYSALIRNLETKRRFNINAAYLEYKKKLDNIFDSYIKK